MNYNATSDSDHNGEIYTSQQQYKLVLCDTSNLNNENITVLGTAVLNTIPITKLHHNYVDSSIHTPQIWTCWNVNVQNPSPSEIDLLVITTCKLTFIAFAVQKCNCSWKPLLHFSKISSTLVLLQCTLLILLSSWSRKCCWYISRYHEYRTTVRIRCAISAILQLNYRDDVDWLLVTKLPRRVSAMCDWSLPSNSTNFAKSRSLFFISSLIRYSLRS